MGNIRNAFVGDGAVVHVFDRLLELLDAEEKACAAREHSVPHVFDAVLVCPLLASYAAVIGKVRAFREDEQPHGVKIRGA